MQSMPTEPVVDAPFGVSGLKSKRVQRLADLSAYATASNFKLPEPDRVLTRHDPEHSFCYVISDGERIAATMRVVFIGSRAEGARVIEGTPPERAVSFPGVALCRGATRKEFRGMGLMTFLVSTGVAVAHRAGLHSAIAVQAVGTAHFNAMVQAGWQSEDVSGKNVKLVALDGPQLKLVYLPMSLLPESQRHSLDRHGDLWEHLRADEAIAEGVRQMPVGMRRQLKQQVG